MSESTTHHFDYKIAIETSIEAAILYQHFHYWKKGNEDNVNVHKLGFIWSFHSLSTLKGIFPYLSERKIRTAIDLLISKRLLISGNFNHLKIDRTRWYTVFSTPYNIKDKKFDELRNNIHVRQITCCIDEPFDDLTNGSSDSQTFCQNDEPLQEIENNKVENNKIEYNKVCEKIKDENVEEIIKSVEKYFDKKYIDDKAILILSKLLKSYDKNKIISAIVWAKNNDFWNSNFLSLHKLDKKNKEDVKYIDVFIEKSKTKSSLPLDGTKIITLD